jgi:hypothetical protein
VTELTSVTGIGDYYRYWLYGPGLNNQVFTLLTNAYFLYKKLFVEDVYQHQALQNALNSLIKLYFKKK